MPSSELFLVGGAIDGRPQKTNGSLSLKAENETRDRKISSSETQVTFRDRRKISVSSGAGDDGGAPVEGKRKDWPLKNKRNATYLTEEEYDEDLAQLDVLLHYVNNLSASLEFLQWENKRISTDLVPTLLNMYDALYAKLSQSPCSSSKDDVAMGKSKYDEDKNMETSNPPRITAKSEVKENCPTYDEELFIHEGEHSRRDDGITGLPGCQVYGEDSQKMICSCPLTSHHEGSCHHTYNSLDTRLGIEHDYDIPESIEKPPDEEVNHSSRSGEMSSQILVRGSENRSKPTIRFTPSVENSNKLRQFAALRGSSPQVSKRGKTDLLYRPLSSISSTSSSSSSSNSLPRVPGCALPSYLASAESLDENDALLSDTETRRRDRSLKARREKALRTGSDDSGVQCNSISLPTPPNLRPRYYDPNLNYMDRVVLEIIETEEIYVRDLKEVIEGYHHHWRRVADSGIAADVIESLFSNIEQIYSFNRKFLSELEQCGTNPVLVAECFVKNNSGFAIYTEYCTNYPRTVRVLTDLMREEQSVRACRERQLCLGHTLPLGSYLLKPVQRVLKYHLLLGNIVKHFDKDLPGHAHIWNALSAMTGIAHHINDMKRRHEHAVRVQEIQSLLYGWEGEDLTTYGELAAEGAFRMFGFKGLRHVFLFDQMLLIAKKKDENILVYKAHIMCSDLMLIEAIPGEPLSFHVIPFHDPRRQYTLECRNLEQKREWTQQLKRVILENYSATIPAHARQLVMELGQAKSNDLSTLESRGGGRRAHCAPEYLEKRKDRRKTLESGINAKLKIRRSSRSRKEKSDKESRSRSVSRTRETDEEEDRQHSPKTAIPVSSTAEKSKLKLPLWRRRSEPGVRARLSLTTTVEKEDEPYSPSPVLRESEEEEGKDSERVQEFTNEDATSRRLSNPEVSRKSIFPSECESLYDGDGNEEVEGENLEHIVSQLLHHQLQVQQKILNKQRRGIIRKKKLGFNYETSDTENEDGDLKGVPPLPTSPPPLLSDSLSSLPFTSEYIDLIFKEPEKEDVDSAEMKSDMVSDCSSLNSTDCRESIGSTVRSASVSRSGSDTGSRNPPSVTVINYDNLLNVWPHSKRKNLHNISPKPKYLEADGTSNSSVADLKRSPLRRVNSSNEALINDLHFISSNSPHYLYSKNNLSAISNDIQNMDESTDAKGRPVTIAVYDPSVSNFDALEKYLNENENCNKKMDPIPDSMCETNISGNVARITSNTHYSIDKLLNTHPEHKIYSKSYVSKSSIKKVLSKLTHLRSTPIKAISEPSNSLSNIFINSDFDRRLSSRKSSLVSSVARQCSKTLKERIKQIRAEDEDMSGKVDTQHEPIYAVPSYKQGSSSLGARLAMPNELDYAIPVIRCSDSDGSRMDLRPDSVLSSSPSSSSFCQSWNKELKPESDREGKSSACILTEENVETPYSGESDASGDSFYEKSFEAIETFLEDDLFRDSAIYSENEDGEGSALSPSSSFRSGTLSPKSSFRNCPFNALNRLAIKTSPKKLTLSSSKSLDGAYINAPDVSIPICATSSTTALSESSSSCSSKKIPPPVPAKPDASVVKQVRSRGCLVQQQLKNLEENQNLHKAERPNKDFEGIKSLDERREELKIFYENAAAKGPRNDFQHRKASLDSNMNMPSINMGFTYSPRINRETIRSGGSEAVESMMSKGWVKHVVGKLQQ